MNRKILMFGRREAGGLRGLCKVVCSVLVDLVAVRTSYVEPLEDANTDNKTEIDELTKKPTLAILARRKDLRRYLNLSNSV